MNTSYYASKAIRAGLHFTVRTSLGECRFKATDAVARTLMPTRDMLGLEEVEYRPRYMALLDKREAEICAEIARLKSEAGEREVVLLCFESLKTPGQFCHRRIFAGWWETKTGEAIAELIPAN